MIEFIKKLFKQQNPQYITFFHNSDYCYQSNPGLFKPMLRKDNKDKLGRPVFYWFNDSWFSNFPNLRDKFLYIFVKNTKKDNIAFRCRSKNFDFDSLYSHYLSFLNERKNKNLSNLFKNGGGKDYCEPPILMSFSDVEPDLILQFADSKDRHGIVIKPEKYKGETITLFDENYIPTPFNKIPLLLKIIPQIEKSLPFIKPQMKTSKYIYHNWVPMVTKTNGTWL